MIDLSAMLEQFEDIRDESSRTEKEEILRDILDSPNAEVFKQLAVFIFNPYRKLNVRVTSDMLEDGEADSAPLVHHSDMWRDFLALIERLESGSVTGNSARAEICSFIAKLELGMGEWFAMFLNKELKIGIGRSTIEKLLPGAIPRFGVQLCSKYDGETFAYPHMVQPKMDGARGVCGRFDDGKFIALSRNGKPFFNVGHILAQLEQLERMYDEPQVFDGEFFAGKWANSISIVRSQKKVDASSMRFYVFDAIPLRQWVTGRTYEVPLQDRDLSLQVALQSLELDRLEAVPHKLAANPSTILAITSQYVDEGWEGSVLKDPRSLYAYDRTDSWKKYKFVKDVDATIVDAELGWLDEATGSVICGDDPRALDMGAHWAPIIRALVVDPGNGILTNVGSGMERSQRYEFLKLHEVGVLVGLIAEVHFQDYTPDGKLLFPRFIRMREDKLTTS
jgi:hypothetical protein